MRLRGKVANQMVDSMVREWRWGMRMNTKSAFTSWIGKRRNEGGAEHVRHWTQAQFN
jgi:hypothetical protein